MYPPLEKDHQVFEKDYCSGYVDKDGKWNTGFYCPPISPEAESLPIYCCGTSVHKYCCNGRNDSTISIGAVDTMKTIAAVEMESEIGITTDYDPSSMDSLGPSLTPNTNNMDVDTITRNTFVAAMICGLVAVTVLMTLVACFYCSCCLLYKKRRNHLSSSGLYRIPASSTTCGLINSTNGSTTPVNSTVFTSECWANSNNPPQGQLHHQRTLALPQPSGSLRAYVNPIINGGDQSSRPLPHPPQHNSNVPNRTNFTSRGQIHSSANTNGNSNNNTRSQSNNNSNGQTIDSSSASSTSTCSNVIPTTALRLQRQLSLFHQRNPNLSRSSQQQGGNSNVNNNNNNGHNQHNYFRNNNSGVPTIYTPGGSGGGTGGRLNTNQNHPTAQVGLSSLISSVSFSSNSSSNLPPPYFLEQYRIRNRVRQPRNPPPTTLLPSYNDIQRQPQQGTSTASSQVRRPPLSQQHSSNSNSNPVTTSTADDVTTNSTTNSSNAMNYFQPKPSPNSSGVLNDLSAPPRRVHKRHQSEAFPSSCTTNNCIISSPTTNNSISINSSPSASNGSNGCLIHNQNQFYVQNMLSSQTLPRGYELSADKILNTTVQIQKSASDMMRRERESSKPKSHQQIRKPHSECSGGDGGGSDRNRKSHSLENVTSVDINLKPGSGATTADDDDEKNINAEVALAFRINETHAN